MWKFTNNLILKICKVYATRRSVCFYLISTFTVRNSERIYRVYRIVIRIATSRQRIANSAIRKWISSSNKWTFQSNCGKITVGCDCDVTCHMNIANLIYARENLTRIYENLCICYLHRFYIVGLEVLQIYLAS